MRQAVFKFELNHDGGVVILSVVAFIEEEARDKICKAECCPNNALTLIEQ